MTKTERYRLKDVDAYRHKKAEWARTADQRLKRTSYMRVWRAKNREKNNAQARASHQRNKHKHIAQHREAHLRKQYGIGQADFERMFKEQCGVCFLCHRTTKRTMHVDHDHLNKRVRGLLCARCNNSLGWLETVIGFEAVWNYLVKKQDIA